MLKDNQVASIKIKQARILLKIWVCFAAPFLFLLSPSYGQEVDNEFQSRFSTELSYKPFKKVTLEIIPELRMEDSFTLDKYLIESVLSYKVNSFLSTSVLYRFIGKQDKNLDIDYLNMFGAYFVLKQDINRFKASFRLRYSCYYDQGITNEHLFRYKFQIKYNIKKCKITPFVAVEPYQLLNSGELAKMRYAAGARYKINKKNSVGLDYKFDYYMLEYTNRHIVNVVYKFSF